VGAAHRRIVARPLLVAAIGLLAACSDSGTGLDDAADRLGDLDQASIVLSLRAGDEGFTIEGAFSVDDEHALPVAELTYTPTDDGPATTVLLTGDDGFVEVDGDAYRLPPAQLDALRIPDGGAASAISQIRLEQWFDGDIEGGGGIFEGAADEAVVLEDVVALASGLGAAAVPLVDDDAVGELTVRAVVAGAGDLHELAATGDGFEFRLELDDHFEPVDVLPPPTARPYEELGQ
jgi:hypothetical protein